MSQLNSDLPPLFLRPRCRPRHTPPPRKAAAVAAIPVAAAVIPLAAAGMLAAVVAVPVVAVVVCMLAAVVCGAAVVCAVAAVVAHLTSVPDRRYPVRQRRRSRAAMVLWPAILPRPIPSAKGRPSTQPGTKGAERIRTQTSNLTRCATR